MTVADSYQPVIYTGNGSTTSFPFSFTIADEDEIVVISRVIATETDTVVDPSLYTVTGTFPGAGEVEYEPSGSPLASTHKLIIARAGEKSQDMDITNQRGFLPAVLEGQLDSIVRRVQELSDKLERTPALRIGTDADTNPVFPEPADGQVLGWEDNDLVNIPSVGESTALAQLYAEQAAASAASVARYPDIATAEAAVLEAPPNFMEVLGSQETGDGKMLFVDPSAVDPGDVNKIFNPSVNRYYRLAYEEGVVRFEHNAMVLDGTEETAQFEDTLALGLDAGLSRFKMPGGKSAELVDARFPEASIEVDFQGSTMLGNFNSNVAGATDRILRADLMRDGGTLIGNMTGNGGLAAGIPGRFVQTASDGVTIIGVGHATTTAAARVGATNGYIGKSFASPRRIYRATVYGTNNAGYLSGSNPSVTITLYGKTGAAPASGTDGTVLGSVTFTDTNNESATPREIVSSNQTAAYDHVWVYISGASGTHTYVGAVEINGVSPYIDLTLMNAVFDGRYNSSVTLLNERTGIDIGGYRNVRLLGSTITGFARGGVTPRIIFNRDVHHTRIHNCLNVVVDGYIQDANALGEELVVSSTDQTTQYLIQNCRTLDKISSGSAISVYYCGPGRVLNNYVQSVSGSAFNLLTRNVECAYNDVLSTGSHGIDLSEGLIYSHGSWVHHNIVRGADDACITGAGNGLRIENNLFTGIGAWGVNCQSAQNLTGNYGHWQETAEHDIVGVRIRGNRSLAGFNESPSGYITNANVRVVGASGSEFVDLEIDVADTAYPTTKTDQNIWLRRIETGKIRGKLMHGQEALVRIDGQCGIIELDHVTMAPELTQGVLGVVVADANLDCLIVNSSEALATFDVGWQHIATSGTGTIDKIVINNSPTIGVASGGAGGVSLPANTRVLRHGKITKRDTAFAYADVAANARNVVTIAVPGALTTDDARVTILTSTALYVGDAWVSNPNEVTFEIYNPTAALIAAGTLNVQVAVTEGGFVV